jgi:hypothetical protein
MEFEERRREGRWASTAMVVMDVTLSWMEARLCFWNPGF